MNIANVQPKTYVAPTSMQTKQPIKQPAATEEANESPLERAKEAGKGGTIDTEA